MNDKAAKNLRYIGLGVVVVSIALLWLPVLMPEGIEIAYSDAIASTLALGIGLLLLAEIGPLVKTLKAGGIEIEFLDSVNDKFNSLDARVSKLELLTKEGGPSPATRTARLAERKPPPALKLKSEYRDDPHKGRFGGKAEAGGYRVSASFRNSTQSFSEVVLRVEGHSEMVKDVECVEFYLHDTFQPDVVPAVFHDHVAELSLLAHGGFTVGVWIPCDDVQLELDLSKVKGAPRLIRDN